MRLRSGAWGLLLLASAGCAEDLAEVEYVELVEATEAESMGWWPDIVWASSKVPEVGPAGVFVRLGTATYCDDITKGSIDVRVEEQHIEVSARARVRRGVGDCGEPMMVGVAGVALLPEELTEGEWTLGVGEERVAFTVPGERRVSIGDPMP